ncbi:type IV-A pilus assembly ATPase PilB [Thermodesulfovibrionales bacterium]|nr:type IV-A pilus assembly ATPase PilB [Thermodesulfovibrionales bacterium]MCL0047302.1 type IV-A pilus assembly ATPase PilB [Thermodesulfovibrionales bacterium]
MATGRPLLGQLLLRSKIITEDQLREAIRVQELKSKRLGSVLSELGYISEETLVAFLSRQYNVPAIKLSDYKIDTSLLRLIPYETLKKYQVIPISRDGGSLRIAITDPFYRRAIDDVKFLSKMKVSVYVASESAIMGAIEKYYPEEEKVREPAGEYKISKEEATEIEKFSEIIGSAVESLTVAGEKEELDIPEELDAPIVKLVHGILMNAVKSYASDIHIEPSEDILRVRYRIDGVLQPFIDLPLKIKNAVVSRVKIMSNIDISERRLPQDGRMKLKFGGSREIDFRVSTLPTIFGEKVVMRLLDKASLQLDMLKLGLEERPLQYLLEAIEKPYGMVLVTGPTGSGKTTTLYSALSRLNKPGVNIITAEDPIEYNFSGINQTQMKEDIGLTFASALRSFLRQDPDIIMVGEMRDFETAEIAIKAALTGHLVLSTLHTNDAPSAITRLMDMKIEPFLISSSVILIVAQRLVRKICESCKEVQKTSEALLLKIGFPPERIKDVKCYIGIGCPKCGKTGYRGRIALYEVMPVNDEIKELILKGASSADIKKEAVRLGMSTLRQDGIKKVTDGITTIGEVLRATF